VRDPQAAFDELSLSAHATGRRVVVTSTSTMLLPPPDAATTAGYSPPWLGRCRTLHRPAAASDVRRLRAETPDAVFTIQSSSFAE
jgi:hypothetical protein